MSLIKLNSGVEISEDIVVAALEKAGIETKPPKPKYIFKTGDVAKKLPCIFGEWRFIVKFQGELHSFDEDGDHMSTGQEQFEKEGYVFVGKQKNLLKT